jgi:hypothetical protein
MLSAERNFKSVLVNWRSERRTSRLVTRASRYALLPVWVEQIIGSVQDDSSLSKHDDHGRGRDLASLRAWLAPRQRKEVEP